MSCSLSAGIGLVHTLVCMFHNSDHDPWSFKDIPLLPSTDGELLIPEALQIATYVAPGS